MQQLFFLLCSLQLGYAWSLNGTCSAQDAEVCGRCTSKACEVHNNNLIGSIENVSSAMECQDWCKRRNDYINDCTYVTYFGSNGAPMALATIGLSTNEIRRRLPQLLCLKISLFRAPVPLDDFNRMRAMVTKTKIRSRVANNYRELIQFMVAKQVSISYLG